MKDENDLLEEQYILLATIKEQWELLKDDRRRLEQFYNQVARGVLEQSENTLKTTNMELIEALKPRISALDRATSRLNFKFILIYSSIFLISTMSLILIFFCFVPSLDEISQRREEFKNLEQKLNLDIARCDGKTCVRVIKSSCHFGRNSDYCKIDPK